jgi:formylglycine-generating enzyme required for sulfatase activity
VALPFQAVPPGAFAMGAPPGEVGRDADEAPVLVTLSCAAFVQRTEVTQRQWMALSDGINPSCFQSADADTCSEAGLHPDGPVEQITWWSALGVHRQQPQPAGGFMERCPHVCPFREPQRRLAGHPQ